MYRVIRFFTDAQDNKHAYHEGDIYPREGIVPSDERIRELMSGNNFQRVPLIELYKGEVKAKTEAKTKEPTPKTKDESAVDESEVKDEVQWTAEEIAKMPFMKLKSIAKQNDIEVKDREAKDIRADLIEKLGL